MITVAQREKLEALIEDLVGAEIENNKGSDWHSREMVLLAERAIRIELDSITEGEK